MISTFYTDDELQDFGFGSIGQNVLISKKASIYSPELIEIGDNVRIDDFCILSGSITFGSFIHISAFCALYGRKGIKLDSYSGLSPRTSLFTMSDDFSGEYLIGPMVLEYQTNPKEGPIFISKYCQVGASSIIMPNVTLQEGAVTGAFTFVNSNLNEWEIYAGIPAKKIKERKKELLRFIKN